MVKSKLLHVAVPVTLTGIEFSRRLEDHLRVTIYLEPRGVKFDTRDGERRMCWPLTRRACKGLARAKRSSYFGHDIARVSTSSEMADHEQPILTVEQAAEIRLHLQEPKVLLV